MKSQPNEAKRKQDQPAEGKQHQHEQSDWPAKDEEDGPQSQRQESFHRGWNCRNKRTNARGTGCMIIPFTPNDPGKLQRNVGLFPRAGMTPKKSQGIASWGIRQSSPLRVGGAFLAARISSRVCFRTVDEKSSPNHRARLRWESTFGKM